MFIKLTDENNDLILINIDKIVSVCLCSYKNKVFTKICIIDGGYFEVKETVSEISLLLQYVDKVI
ncbi:MAG: hypothetical protein NC332_04335 [Firmicutes bacterium]|nr:hypothetical protein [Bacillota bacterium]